MENEPSIQLSDTQARTCPNCGGKVSSRAKTCLICNTDLPALPFTDAPAARPVRVTSARHLVGQIALTVVGLLMLTGIVWGFMVIVRGAGAPQPTPVATGVAVPEAGGLTPPAPVVTDSLTALATPAVTATPAPFRKHTIEAGDTLLGVAQAYNTTVDEIKALNNLQEDDILQIGRELLIPPLAGAASPEQVTGSGSTVHVVQSGETLLGIAQHYGVSMFTIQQLNNLPNPELLREGQQLVIPVGPTPTATQGPPPTATPRTKYAAPPILAPLDGAKFQGSETPIVLQWASTTLLRLNEWYLVTLEKADSDQTPTLLKTKTTAIYVPVELFPPEQETRRLFVWHVKIVRQLDDKPTFEDASLSGQVRSFLWLQPSATPTPTPSPN